VGHTKRIDLEEGKYLRNLLQRGRRGEREVEGSRKDQTANLFWKYGIMNKQERRATPYQK